MGSSYFPPTQLQMQIKPDNGLLMIQLSFTTLLQLKSEWTPALICRAVDFGHPDALNSKIRLQLLFPQWHPVVNYLNRCNRERERIRCGCKESKIERVCTYFGNPSRVQMNISTHYWSGTVTTILYLSPPTSCSQSLHLLLSRCQIQIRLIFFLSTLSLSCSHCLSLMWCPRV